MNNLPESYESHYNAIVGDSEAPKKPEEAPKKPEEAPKKPEEAPKNPEDINLVVDKFDGNNKSPKKSNKKKSPKKSNKKQKK